MSRQVLLGRRILVVEDEYFQAREIVDMIAAAGGDVVGPTGGAGAVLGYLGAVKIDAALLDINLGRGLDFATADALQRAGIPFALVTGYDRSVLPPNLSAVPLLQKPANKRAVLRLLRELIGTNDPAPRGSQDGG